MPSAHEGPSFIESALWGFCAGSRGGGKRPDPSLKPMLEPDYGCIVTSIAVIHI